MQEILKKYQEAYSCKKNDIVFSQGEIDQNFYFIEKGLLKAFYITEDGKEYIKSFLKEGDIISNLSSCIQGVPCTFSLQCLEDCLLQKIPFQRVTEIVNSTPTLSPIVVGFLTNLALKKEIREFEFLCLSASERYQRLIERTPDIAERVTLGDIAKFLGITQVALSRIRKNVR